MWKELLLFWLILVIKSIKNINWLLCVPEIPLHHLLSQINQVPLKWAAQTNCTSCSQSREFITRLNIKAKRHFIELHSDPRCLYADRQTLAGQGLNIHLNRNKNSEPNSPLPGPLSQSHICSNCVTTVPQAAATICILFRCLGPPLLIPYNIFNICRNVRVSECPPLKRGMTDGREARRDNGGNGKWQQMPRGVKTIIKTAFLSEKGRRQYGGWRRPFEKDRDVCFRLPPLRSVTGLPVFWRKRTSASLPAVRLIIPSPARRVLISERRRCQAAHKADARSGSGPELFRRPCF